MLAAPGGAPSNLTTLAAETIGRVSFPLALPSEAGKMPPIHA